MLYLIIFLFMLFLIFCRDTKYSLHPGNLESKKVKDCKLYLIDECCYLRDSCPEKAKYTITGNGVVTVKASDLLKSCKVQQQLKHKLKNN